MTVLERLRELEGAGCLGTCEKFEACNCAKYAADHLPTLLALAEAVKEEFGGIEDFGPAATVYVRGDGLAKIGEALADLEKEAT